MRTSQEQIEHACQAIQQSLEPLRVAAKCQAEQLGHCVLQLVSYFDSLVQNTLEAAGRIVSHKQQMLLLDQAKTVCEAAIQFLYTAKEGAGNPKAPDMLHRDIDEGADATRDAVVSWILPNEVAMQQQLLFWLLLCSCRWSLVGKGYSEASDVAMTISYVE